MNDRVMQFRVGVVVLATAIIAGILVVLFGDLPSLVQATYPLKLSFADARGIATGTPVRKNGILVGRVARVELDERGGVSVLADIDSYVPIYRDEQPRIASTLLGCLAHLAPEIHDLLGQPGGVTPCQGGSAGIGEHQPHRLARLLQCGGQAQGRGQ